MSSKKNKEKKKHKCIKKVPKQVKSSSVKQNQL